MKILSRIVLPVALGEFLIGFVIPAAAAQLCLFEFNGDALPTARAQGLVVNPVVFEGADVSDLFPGALGVAILSTDLDGQYAASLRYTAEYPANVFPTVTFRHSFSLWPEPGYTLRVTGVEYDVWYKPFSPLFSTASAWAVAEIQFNDPLGCYHEATAPVVLDNQGLHRHVAWQYGGPEDVPVRGGVFELFSETPYLISPGVIADGPPETRTHTVYLDNVVVYGSVELIPEASGSHWIWAALLCGFGVFRQVRRRTPLCRRR